MEDEIVKEFLVESYENLDQLDQELVALETDPDNPSRIASIFRTVHTIKGTSGFLGYTELERITHVGENLLSRIRDGELKLTERRTTGLLKLVDAIRDILGRIEDSGDEGDVRYADLAELLGALVGPEGEDGTSEAQPAPSAAEPEPQPAAAAAAAAAEAEAEAEAEAAEPAAEAKALEPAEHAEEPAVEASPPPPGGSPPPAPADDAGRSRSGEARSHGQGLSETSIRVDVGLLDNLMNLVGELVLARNQIIQFAQSNAEASFVSASQRLNLITTELQEGLMKTRMQPIGNVWNKFPRVVRDLALNCKKQVEIEMEGKDTELDRTILEAIKDPLTHVVRNAVDHGIEAPEERVARGKPATGRIVMRAYHEGGQVNIEISDDGSGVDVQRVREKAISRGLISPERAARMSERELAGVIFMPGFSTAAQVTSVSGRGVGMDVVRTNIEKIGGVVDVANRQGQGMTLKIKIPLTLAIIPALIVGSAGERFAIPQVNLLELVRLDGSQAQTAVEAIHGVPVYRLRGNLLPLAYLAEQLETESPDAALAVEKALNIVILQADDRSFGLVVDEVFDTEEIVVKPLGKEIKNLSAYAGTTIMGDGKVALILDVLGLAHRARIVGEGARAPHEEPAPAGDEVPRRTLLLFQAGEESRMAVPLELVSRLEEIPDDRIERAAGQDVVQYRGDIMPLVDVATCMGRMGGEGEPGIKQVIVHSRGDRVMGLVVDRIIDIVEEAVQIKALAPSMGLLGSAVVQGRVTDLVDVRGLIEAVDPTFFAGDEDPETQTAA